MRRSGHFHTLLSLLLKGHGAGMETAIKAPKLPSSCFGLTTIQTLGADSCLLNTDSDGQRPALCTLWPRV